MLRSPRKAPTYLSETASFKQYLDYYTQRAGLSENKLAIFSRLNQSTLNKIANGRLKNVNISMLICICLALGLNEAESIDLLSRRERAFSPANDTHRVYLELIRIYSMKKIDYKRLECDSQCLLEEADAYLKKEGKAPLPKMSDSERKGRTSSYSISGLAWGSAFCYSIPAIWIAPLQRGTAL